MYKNSEGYNDPTAGDAMTRCYAKEHSDQRKAQRKKNRKERLVQASTYKGKPKIYVVSPYAGDVKKNRSDAILYCQYVIKQGKIPVASHLLYPQMLDDNNPFERETGLVFGLELLVVCDEVWVFGKYISTGMKREIYEAEKFHKPVRYIEEVNAE